MKKEKTKRIIDNLGWELEQVYTRKDGKTYAQFSSRNSGCADFVSVPIEVVAKIALAKGIKIEGEVKK